jgi:chloramphenicol 3-O phosphotransferase
MTQSRVGRVIVLNGPSSAGKTTLARAVRDACAPRVAAVSLDQFFPCVARSHPNDWHLFAALTTAAFATAASLANGGWDVLLDTVFERADCVALMRSALAAHDVALVAVTCPLDILEARERSRGDRRPGQARDQFDRVIQNVGGYDLVLDTGALSLDACVERISGLLGACP